MTNKNVKLIMRICGIALSALLICVGILLIISCVSIYRLGDRPFTPENISNAFSKISIPVYVTLATVVAVAIFSLILPRSEEKARGVLTKKNVLARLSARVDRNGQDENIIAKLDAEQKRRKIMLFVAVGLCILSAVPSLILVLSPSSYTADYNASVVTLSYVILPSAFLTMGICVAYNYLEGKSLDRSISLTKSALASQKGMAQKAPEAQIIDKGQKTVFIFRTALLVVAFALLIVGIVGGGMADVLSKAVNICTECIGLG